jgi:hypothetical protein
MNITDRRKGISEAVIKDKFIRQQLQEEGAEIDKATNSIMSRRGFKSADWFSKRGITVEGNNMVLRHKPKHRFVDMRSRQTKQGKKNKKSHPIHNRILYGHANDIIKRLHFGFTQAVKEELAREV